MKIGSILAERSSEMLSPPFNLLNSIPLPLISLDLFNRNWLVMPAGEQRAGLANVNGHK